MESLQIPNWVVKELETASIGSHGNCPRFLRGFDSYSKEFQSFWLNNYDICNAWLNPLTRKFVEVI
ncbi:hypothetical protein [Lactococcus lactis]|uniref:hypothetical protein n=1 Tax=Lactococcus lactis TaxID=1358 RepID=UPI00071CD89C|nr:hypothetical protein [Lactococcus lactis]KSU20459.1 hypothetical protein LMG14418_1053 [Lactococcus lactis subsp. lactis]MBU6000701.1 hypothetical protein [Lactococcus lactis]MCT3126614.1 hypothetical protein [Lactococcus lactis]MCX7531311.1 hypothetical protein [Lactococcus lactis]MDM7474705.1 hypothetical protein [Lactococcus lactis]